MLESTSKFKVHDIVYNKGGFAIARGHWEGGADLSLACRWHEEGGIGYPQTFGKPQWMLLPQQDMTVEFIRGLDQSSGTKVVLTLT